MKVLEKYIIFVGEKISYLIPVMVVVMIFVIVSRYFFGIGRTDIQELVMYFHALVFLGCAGYVMNHDEHVRVDIFYRRFSARQQAWVNGMGHVAFPLPLCGLIGWGPWDYVIDSWAAKEASPEPGGLPFMYLLKTLIPAMAVLLALQALAQIACALTILRRSDNA